MKIAYFTDTYLPQLNGVSVSVQTVVGALRKKGHTVFVFAPEIKGHEDKSEDIIRLKSFKILSSEPAVLLPMLLPNKNYRKVMSLDFDLIHAHGNGAFSLLGYQVALMRGIPYVLTFHNLHTKYTHYIFKGKIVTPRMVAGALKAFGNICDGVIAPSFKMKAELLRFGIKKHIEVIPNPIEIEKFGVGDREFLRKKFGILPKDPIILSVGRLGKEKNFKFILKCFATIHKKYHNTHFVLIGTGTEEKNLKELAESLKLGEYMHFAGKEDASQMPSIYAGADIFMFASTTETQGMVVSEAAASGLPLIVVKDSAYENVVTEKNGYSLPLLQKEFVEKTIFLLQNPNVRKKMGEESRKIVKQIYGQADIADRLVNYYNDILISTSGKKRKRKIFSQRSLRVISRASSVVEKMFR
ncbi:MAG: hypothetical protein COU27_01665 [Candidatus Levybacteria bacterium CG10_big_fil_rev_8_21_14_0_10_36_7]|nr:MAG: hypothetical protein COU27_01665 [Candidatus Levybacteria bacterium CG10_big_fil_rev_8_21_14_0_10_36_7]